MEAKLGPCERGNKDTEMVMLPKSSMISMLSLPRWETEAQHCPLCPRGECPGRAPALEVHGTMTLDFGAPHPAPPPTKKSVGVRCERRAYYFTKFGGPSSQTLGSPDRDRTPALPHHQEMRPCAWQ